MQEMSPNSREGLPSASKRRVMTAAAETPKNIIRDIIGPRAYGFNVKPMLADIADRTGMTVRRVRAYWNEEVNNPRPLEVKALKELRDGRTERAVPPDVAARIAKLERLKEARDAEVAELRARLARVEETIALARALVAGGMGGQASPEVPRQVGEVDRRVGMADRQG